MRYLILSLFASMRRVEAAGNFIFVDDERLSAIFAKRRDSRAGRLSRIDLVSLNRLVYRLIERYKR